MRCLLVVAAAFALAGCGGAATVSRSPAAPIVPDAPAPPIAGASAPAPDWLLRELHPGAVDSQGAHQYRFCFDTVTSDGSQHSDCNGTPTAEQLAELEAQQKAAQAAVAPAPGSEPRVVATLPIAGGDGTASFAAWTTAGGKPCWATEVEVGGGGGGGGPGGPCVRTATPAAAESYLPPCDALCLSSSGAGSSEEDMVFVLGGTVPADADALRVTLAGGAVTTYPLSGPLFPGFPQRRIFLLELGARDWRMLELVRGGAVVRTVEMPKLISASQDCRAQLGPPPKPVGMATGQADLQKLFAPYEAKLNECLRAAGALPQLSGTVPSSQPLPTTTP